MLSGREQERYSRHLILAEFGLEKQILLRKAKVLVVGAGGLGCPALQYLVAAGVGTIGIVDGDSVSLSNLQRQVLFNENQLGVNKAVAAKDRLQLQNSDVAIISYSTFIDHTNALSIIESFDLVLDGSDNFTTRYLLNDACVMLGKPLIYGAIHKFTGQVSVFNFKGGPTYRCLFPEPPAVGEMPGCGEIGVLGVLPGVIGTLQACEAIKIITNLGTNLSGRLMTIDLLNHDTTYFNFETNPANLHIEKLEDVHFQCDISVKTISWEEFIELKTAKTLRLIDVREPDEYLLKNIGGENIPLSTWNSVELPVTDSEMIVIHCETGKRARQAAESLAMNGVEVRVLTDIRW